MEYVKFIFKFNNHVLLDPFNHYFRKLETVHKYNTKQKQRNEFFQFRISSESGKNFRSYLFKSVEESSNEISPLSICNV